MAQNPAVPFPILANRPALYAGMFLTACVAILVCLIPKPENDLFFILRTGDDILRTHTLPHTDTYSWTNFGTRWDVPEWGAFVCYSLAYKGGQFFGTWLLMAALTVTAGLVVYGWLARYAGAGTASALTSLMLLALSPFVQERPYAFSYLILPLALITLTEGRKGRPRLLLFLPLLCALWANLHQGVLAFVALLGLYAVGDAWEKKRWAQTALLTVACAAAVCVSPYGTGIYRNVWVTLADPTLTAHVTEWRSVWTVPVSQTFPFWLLAALIFAALARAKTRMTGEVLTVCTLFLEGVLHVRNTALFAVGALVICASHLPNVSLSLLARHKLLLSTFATLALLLMGTVTVLTLQRSLHGRNITPENVAEAVARLPRYPEAACTFLDRQHSPTNLRLLNSFEDGGFLMWRRPTQRVFIDGRLDVYAGRTFHDNLVLEQKQGTPVWVSLVKQYNFDVIICANPRMARAFTSLPQYELAFWNGRRQWVFLRR